MSEPQKVSFEQGLERLEEIAEKLGEAELSVEETIALLRDGKGLEQALRAYLETDAQLDAAARRLGRDRARDGLGAERQRARVGRNVDGDAHAPGSSAATSSSNRCGR